MRVFNKVRLVLRIHYLKLLLRIRSKMGHPIYYIGGSEALPPPALDETYLLAGLEQDYRQKCVD